MHAIRKILAVLGITAVGLLGPAVVPAPSSVPVMASHPGIEQLLPGIPAAHASGGSFTLTNQARTDLLNGTIKSTDTFKWMLLTSGNNASATSTTCSGLTNEVSSTDTGYTTGGATHAVSLSGTTSVTWSTGSGTSGDVTWTAGSAGLSLQTVADCDTTAGLVLAFGNADSGGATVTASAGQTYTIHQDATHPIFTFA